MEHWFQSNPGRSLTEVQRASIHIYSAYPVPAPSPPVRRQQRRGRAVWISQFLPVQTAPQRLPADVPLISSMLPTRSNWSSLGSPVFASFLYNFERHPMDGPP